MSSSGDANDSPVVVIGAGASGLIALKILNENGIPAVCYEKSDNFGGLWRFRETAVDGMASVARNTIINTSKEICALSDFPPPKELPNYMHNTQFLSYLEQYAEKFQLLGQVKLRHEIISVNKADNFADTGEWMVHIRLHTDEGSFDQVRRAPAVLVCIGHQAYPNEPNFPGQSNFRGKIIHTHAYKDTAGLEGKRVLVVGIGASGLDAAGECSIVAKQVYLSTRRGGWIIQRLGTNGLPVDFGMTRYTALIEKNFPQYVSDRAEKQANAIFDHELYNLKPKHNFAEQHPTISDTLPHRILNGSIVMKGDVLRFTEEGVVFVGEEDREYQLDAVVLGTGYSYLFPFLEKGVVRHDGNSFDLYKRILPPELAATHPTLAIVGLVQPLGPFFPAVELQCRWMAKVLKGELTLPSEHAMLAEVRQYDRWQKARFVATARHTIEVEYVPYMDSLAQDVGCKPNLVKLFFSDRELFRRVFFGPIVSYQFRLTGPHAWHGARDAILTVMDRMKTPFNTRVVKARQYDAPSGQYGAATSGAWTSESICNRWLAYSMAIVASGAVGIGAVVVNTFV